MRRSNFYTNGTDVPAMSKEGVFASLSWTRYITLLIIQCATFNPSALDNRTLNVFD